MREFEVDKGFFGAAGSPLVEGGKVIANVGGKKAGIVAFDAKTGKVIWTATTDAASYSSGIAATMLGRRYAVFLTRAGLVGLDPANGQVRFQRPWRARQAASVNAATPVIVGNTIFVSAEYGPGAGVLQFDGTKLADLWASNDVLSNHYATSVFHEGPLYGFHGRQEFGPVFRAVDLQSGKVLWSTPRFGAGSVTLAGNRLVIVRESGELLIAAASPNSFQQVATAQVLPRDRAGVSRDLGRHSVCSQRQHAGCSGSPMKRFRVRGSEVLGAGSWFLVLGFACAALAAQNPQALLDRAVDEFEQGRFAPSGATFDEVAKAVPGQAPQLWQRGIALYYAGRYADCRRQFESHRTVNPDDVENAAWHFLCVAREQSPDKARAALLPVGPDRARPCVRSIRCSAERSPRMTC